MTRINLAATIDGIDLPPSTWAWLDLIGDAMRLTQLEARAHEEAFKADSSLKRVQLESVRSHLSGLQAIYVLLRMELVAQAAGQARLLCEGVITLRYILEKPEDRASAFLDYSAIDAYESANAIVRWDASTAEASLVEAMAAKRDEFRADYDKQKERFQTTSSSGKVHRFKNWSNLSISEMSKATKKTERLYDLIYRQLSAYVHGSAWSQRHLHAYTAMHYDANVVFADIAQVSLATLSIWQVLAESLEAEMGWTMSETISSILDRADALRMLRPDGS